MFLLFIQSAHPTITRLSGISGRTSEKDLLGLFVGGAQRHRDQSEISRIRPPTESPRVPTFAIPVARGDAQSRGYWRNRQVLDFQRADFDAGCLRLTKGTKKRSPIISLPKERRFEPGRDRSATLHEILIFIFGPINVLRGTKNSEFQGFCGLLQVSRRVVAVYPLDRPLDRPLGVAEESRHLCQRHPLHDHPRRCRMAQDVR